MRIQKDICIAVIVILASMWQASAQELASAKLSESLHTMLYPEIICPRCVIPEWSSG